MHSEKKIAAVLITASLILGSPAVANESEKDQILTVSEISPELPQQRVQTETDIAIYKDRDDLAKEKLEIRKNPPQKILAETKASENPEQLHEVRLPVYRGDKSKPEVFLTIDDGFQINHINTMLDILRSKNIQASFFIVGTELAKKPGIWQQAVKEGHFVLNHTYGHAYLNTLTDEQIEFQVKEWEVKAELVLGKEYIDKMKRSFPFIRFPGGAGHRDARVLSIVTRLGYTPVAWSSETVSSIINPNKDRPIEQISSKIEEHVVATAQNGIIVLLHSNQWDTPALTGIIDGVQKKGLTFAHIDKIPR